MAKKKKKFVDLEEMNVILRIPKDAVGLTIRVQLIGEDGELKKVERKLSVADIHTARTDFLDNVEFGDDYDAKFELTDEGREYLERLAELAGGDL